MILHDIANIMFLLITMLLWGITPLLEKMGLKEIEPLTEIFSGSAP